MSEGQSAATVTQSARTTMASIAEWHLAEAARLTGAMTAERAAEIVRRHSTAAVERAFLIDGHNEAPGWVLRSPNVEHPQVYTDAGLIDFAVSLTKLHG